VEYRGFALVDIFQPCVSFNKVNTFKWYKERVTPIDESHDPTDRAAALDLAFQWGEEIPIGILYRSDRPSLESQHVTLKQHTLVERYTG
jgi:2-oxoglutarate ferredoxin oxidoreductase subunit beta